MTRLQEMKLIAEGSERDRLELQKQLDAQRLRADTAEAERSTWETRACSEATKLHEAEQKLAAAEQRATELEAGVQASVEVINSLHDQLSVAEQRIAELSELLKKFFELVEMAPVSSGVCCCGSDTSQANHGDHMAVDQWDHSVSLWGREIEAALNPNPEAESHE